MQQFSGVYTELADALDIEKKPTVLLNRRHIYRLEDATAPDKKTGARILQITTDKEEVFFAVANINPQTRYIELGNPYKLGEVK